jgi:hypothetical protein
VHLFLMSIFTKVLLIGLLFYNVPPTVTKQHVVLDLPIFVLETKTGINVESECIKPTANNEQDNS